MIQFTKKITRCKSIKYTSKMLDRMVSLYRDCKTIPQIRGIMTIEFGKIDQVFTDENIQKKLDDIEYHWNDD